MNETKIVYVFTETIQYIRRFKAVEVMSRAVGEDILIDSVPVFSPVVKTRATEYPRADVPEGSLWETFLHEGEGSLAEAPWVFEPKRPDKADWVFVVIKPKIESQIRSRIHMEFTLQLDEGKTGYLPYAVRWLDGELGWRKNTQPDRVYQALREWVLALPGQIGEIG